MIATAFEGFKRVWPEMPDRVAAEADNRMRVFDLLGALSVVRDWEMTVRCELARRWLSVPVISAGGMALTAEQVEDVRTLVGHGGSDYAEAFNRLRALFPATEPAGPCSRGVCSANNGHEGTCAEASGWAEPAEEETKAEVWDAGFEAGYDHAGCEHTPSGISIDPPLNPYDERTAPFSSPVVPAPTETGPWQTWEAVPEGVTVKSANGERFRKTGVGAIHLLTNGVGDCCQVYAEVNSLPAPFFAVEDQS